MKKIFGSIILMLVVGLITSTHGFEMDQVQIHGFASGGYLKSDHNNYMGSTEKGSFEFNEAAINFMAELTDDIKIGMQFYSYDLGKMGNNNVKMDRCFLDYHWKEELGLRVGKFKTIYGLYNDIRDYDMLRIPILLPISVYHRNNREMETSMQGSSIYGNIDMGAGGTFIYDLMGGTVSIDSDSGMLDILSTNTLRLESLVVDRMMGGRLAWKTPLKGFLLCASAYQYKMHGDMNINGIEAKNRTPKLLGSNFSAEYNYKNFTLSGEYVRVTGARHISMDMSPLGLPDTSITSHEHVEQYYGMISYYFTDWFSVSSYYSVLNLNKYDRSGHGQEDQGHPDYYSWHKNLAISTRFDITDFWLIKLEMHVMDGAYLCTLPNNPDGVDEQHWMLYALKTTFSF